MEGELPTIRDEDVIVRTDESLSVTLDGEAVVLDSEEGMYYGMNDIGTKLWTQLETPTRVAELESVLVSEYDVDEAVVEADIREFILSLIGAGLVKIQEQHDAV